MVMQWQKDLPEAQGSVTTRVLNRKELWRSKSFKLLGYNNSFQICVWVTWFDGCGNGYNTFHYKESIVYTDTFKSFDSISITKEVAQYMDMIPEEIKALKQWEGCFPFGPWCYIENTLWHASDKDCYGLRKGERKQIVTNKGELMWELLVIKTNGEECFIYEVDKLHSGSCPSNDMRLEWRPCYREGEGKECELDYARSTAIWPEATDEQLIDKNLATALRARLPDLVMRFRKMIESLGFVW